MHACIHSGHCTLCVKSGGSCLGCSGARGGVWLVSEPQDLGGLEGLPALVRPERLLQAPSAGRLACPVVLDPHARLGLPILLQRSLQHERCSEGPLQPSALLASAPTEALSFTELPRSVHKRLWKDPLSCASSKRLHDLASLFQQHTCELPLPSAEAWALPDAVSDFAEPFSTTRAHPLHKAPGRGLAFISECLLLAPLIRATPVSGPAKLSISS